MRADAYLGGGYERGTLWPGAVDTGNPYERFGLETESWDYWRSSPSLDPGQKPAARLDIASGKGQTTLRPTATGGVPRVYTVVVRARDEYGRDVLASREVTVHPAGLKFELPGFPNQTGEEVRARVLVRQVGKGAPLAGRPVAVTVVRAYSEAVQVGGRTESRDREEVVSRREERSGAGGRSTSPSGWGSRGPTSSACRRGTRRAARCARLSRPPSCPSPRESSRVARSA